MQLITISPAGELNSSLTHLTRKAREVRNVLKILRHDNHGVLKRVNTLNRAMLVAQAKN